MVRLLWDLKKPFQSASPFFIVDRQSELLPFRFRWTISKGLHLRVLIRGKHPVIRFGKYEWVVFNCNAFGLLY